ncbi:MAG TPA: hypothetical protein VG148_17635 [Pyrinomonadaceae bacterium]|nr:hypothetical protein [Pyrinomonadaceae bacterium]
MNALKKLTGLLVFVAALAGAFALSRYFSGPRPAVREETPQPVTPGLPQPPAGPAPPPVSFQPRLVVLDLSGGKSYVTLELEQGAADPAPERLWVWADFFSPAGVSRTRCAGLPVEVRQPFMRGRRATVVVEIPAQGCDAPRAATYYARVNVSAESAEAAARPPGDPDSYDIKKATPVVVQGARLWKEPDAGRHHTPDASRRRAPRSEREE